MAKKTNQKPEDTAAIERAAAQAAEQDECPTFTLRADKPGHIRALMAALQELPSHEVPEGLRTLRLFDLYEEMHR